MGQALDSNNGGMAVAPMPDDRGALTHTDEPGASTFVHDGLARLKRAGRAELQLQKPRSGNRVQTKRVHSRRVRQHPFGSF